jgi:glucosamine-6-phosphate deaminase
VIVEGPQLHVVEDADWLARVAADLVGDALGATPDARVVVATGRTPMGLYAELAERRRAGALDTSQLTVVQLDEYLGLEPDDRRSLFGWMRTSFLEPLNIADDRVVRLPLDGDLDEACAAYDAAMDVQEPLELAILGLGPNGHLGFNEPPSEASAGTRVVTLTPETLASNASYWDGAPVPTRAVTLGLRSLLSAQTIVLVVSGAAKRQIVHRALEGAVGPDVPASYLQDTVGDVHVVVDRDAWGAPT